MYVRMSSSRVETSVHTPASSLVPFEELPNLPKAAIPQIHLDIQRVDIESLALAITQGSDGISTQRRVGYHLADNCTQTEESHILDLKHTTAVIQTLVQDIGQLHKDLSTAKHVLKADYENRVNERATELYCRSSARCAELERRHEEKIEIVRKSYRTQLNNAIQKIAGEYQAYYDELLQGKTGRTDAKIRQLRQKIEIQELQLEQGAEKIAELTQKVEQYEEEFGEKEKEAPPSAPPPGIPLEEAKELRQSVERLEEEVVQLKAELAAHEDSNTRLSHQLETTNRKLEDERAKVNQLRHDMEVQKKKTKTDQEKAAKMAESQRAALEKEWIEKAKSAENEAALKAQEEAERKRIREQAKFQEEMNRRQHLEEELRANQRHRTPTPPPDSEDLSSQVKRLKKIEQRQRAEIDRLTGELERTNRVWEMKLAIMQRNFHALRDELYVRHSLQRQAASLHHASVGYASSNHSVSRHGGRHLKPLPKIKCKESDTTLPLTPGVYSSPDIPRAPSPTPELRPRAPSPAQTVHFDPPLETH